MAKEKQTTSTIKALRMASLFAIAIAVGLMIATLMGYSELPIPIALMLLVAGLSLGMVASAKAKDKAT